ncbi:HSP20-like chaperone [Xylona heveae TC161]|uniref:HSP20-like chaperone n=1 Tax=Xylona heveae (strain CBS 132557 / TC161) TaxID=1328760 RepID=A0A165HYR9_XYLHT|nr:HSP20-like chaperone [Xylona heveae TC161]KZF24109.1 HSP20-like chaperone [Xylona heveae TC161]
MPSIKELNQSNGPFWDFTSGLEDSRNHPPFAFGGPGMPPYTMDAFHMRRGASAEEDMPPTDERFEDSPAHRESHPSADRFGPGPDYGFAGFGELPFRNGPPHFEGLGHHRGGHGPAGRGGMSFGGRRGGFGGPCARGGMGRGGGFGARGGLRHQGPRGGLHPFIDPRARLFESPFGGRAIDGQEFRLAVDVFDTDPSYVIYAYVPGARKEDISVTWDVDDSELSISGVVHRLGDEEFLKSLVLSETQIGAFDRKIKLGTRAEPALIEQDAITAKLEDGILRINVPKQEKEYIEVKKVDIE